jgi:hypothetical protein
MKLYDNFEAIIDPAWKITQQGSGSVYRRPGSLYLALVPQDDTAYHNAQITDYDPRTRDFRFRPPLTMRVRALSSLHPANIKGTAGFGFWNHAFAPDRRGFGLPQTLWFFFSSPPSNIALARDVPGTGWKAATLDATRWQVRGLLPLAPLAALMMRSSYLYRALWPLGQRALGVAEAALDAELLQEFHDYRIEWRIDGATFSIDDRVVLRAHTAPRSPLGFIAWMDNQYAIVTPQGVLQMGITPVEKSQALVIQEIEITGS